MNVRSCPIKTKEVPLHLFEAIQSGEGGIIPIPELGNVGDGCAYKYPPRDVGAELRTLHVHASLHEEAVGRCDPDWVRLEECLSATYVGRPLDPSLADIEVCTQTANSVSSPGYPWVQRGFATKQAVISDPNALKLAWSVVYYRMCLLAGLMASELEWYRLHPTAAVLDGVRDFAKIFIKNEPHKLNKINDGRLRIIISTSITDYLLERVLWHNQLQAEQRELYSHGNLVGIGFTAEQARDFTYAIQKKAAEHDAQHILSIDAKAWDWSLTTDVMALEVKVYTQQAQHYADFLRVAHQQTVMTHCYVVRDGRCVEMHHRGGIASGMMTSGRLRTAQMNSTIACAFARYAGASYAYAMGDDCLALIPDGVSLGSYEELGPRLGDNVSYDIDDDCVFEFCKHYYALQDPDSIHMLEVSKTVCQLITEGYTEERETSLSSGVFRASKGHASLANLHAIIGLIRGKL